MNRLLILAGSPRKKGQTAEILACFLESLEGWAAEIIRPYTLDIAPCVDCRHCHAHKCCRITDGMTGIYKKIEKADGFLIASPVYFYSLPAPLKALVDRLQPYWSRRVLHAEKPPKRKGALILTGGAPPHEGQFTAAEAAVRSVYRELGVDLLGSVCFAGSDHCKAGKKEAEAAAALAQIFS